MESVDPVRGPYPIPRQGRLPHNLLPGLHEVVVLRSRSGKVLALPRGTPPTFSQRMTGQFIEAYYVDYGSVHSRTFAAALPTGDLGVDLVAEIDVEMSVEDCVQAVVERRGPGYLGDQLAKWTQQHASGLSSRFKVYTDGDLANLAGQILGRLQTESQRLSFSGLKIRELRVRLRFADQKTVAEAGATTLAEKVRAQRTKDLYAMYLPVFGPDFAKIRASLSGSQESEIPAFLQRLQAEQYAANEHKYEALISLLRGESIEPHLKEQLLKDLASALKLPGLGQPARELASALQQAGAASGDETDGGGDLDEAGKGGPGSMY